MWDPTYQDESWIDTIVQLLPRLQRMVDRNYPGLQISIGEYNFGAEDDMSGGLALAEALGRLGQHEGLFAAYYWTYPASGTPAYQAFRAFRNFDGHGGQFLDWSVPAKASKGTSLHASIDSAGKKVVAVALNFDAEKPAQSEIVLNQCGAMKTVKAYRFVEGQLDILPARAPALSQGRTRDMLPPYSMTVYVLE
ncbi:MAG: hypothetical protein R3C68_14000 [Myxococcota bacterium]